MWECGGYCCSATQCGSTEPNTKPHSAQPFFFSPVRPEQLDTGGTRCTSSSTNSSCNSRALWWRLTAAEARLQNERTGLFSHSDHPGQPVVSVSTIRLIRYTGYHYTHVKERFFQSQDPMGGKINTFFCVIFPCVCTVFRPIRRQ